MHDFIQQLGIKQQNKGVSTGVNWLISTGESISSSSPVDGKEIAVGEDFNKKSAEQNASYKALKSLGIDYFT